MLKKILIVLAVLVVGFIVVVMVQPGSYHVERTTQIEAPAEVVWAEVSDFGKWKNWSHWHKSDPEQKVTLSGEPGTVGHKSSWVGEKTGTGTMTITAADKPTHLAIGLEFVEPMKSTADTAMKLVSKGDAVEVTWSMGGENGFMGKFFGLVMGGMDGMIGTAYAEGLANIKEIAEANAAKVAAAEPEPEAAADTPAAE